IFCLHLATWIGQRSRVGAAGNRLALRRVPCGVGLAIELLGLEGSLESTPAVKHDLLRDEEDRVSRPASIRASLRAQGVRSQGPRRRGRGEAPTGFRQRPLLTVVQSKLPDGDRRS